MTERMHLEIASLGALGDGIADRPGGRIFVPRTLPGERIVAEVAGERGTLLQIEHASPARTTPSCPHFGACGGCAAQHIGPLLYLEWKREMVRAAFQHRALEPTIEPVVGVPPGRRRRATFTARRTGGAIVLGFHEEASHALVDIATCPVLLPNMVDALPAIRSIASAVLSKDGSSLRLAVTAAIEGLDISLLDAPAAIDAPARARLAEIASRAGIVRIMAEGRIVAQSAPPRLALGGTTVPLPPAAFIQATAEAETAMAEVIAGAVGKARHIADLFCGLGTFTFALARRARVLAVDGDAAAIEALALAVKATPGIKPVESRVRDLMREPLSRTELQDLDAVTFDPPRAGAKAQAEMLARSKVPVIVAVSCNPATLARDCRILIDGGYRIERVVPIDQFVWSPHVEAVAVLRK